MALKGIGSLVRIFVIVCRRTRDAGQRAERRKEVGHVARVRMERGR